MNKRKILETARKLAQKGAKSKALKEYQKLVKLDPKDAKLRLEIGDAHRRWGQVKEAIETYTLVASQYTKEGFDARAVAVYKQILNLDAEHFSAYQPLAELYERMGLTGDAINTLQTAADGLHRKGEKHGALELLRRMATIDPTNTTSRIKVAELLRQEDLIGEAISEYDEVAQEFERQGDVESAGKVYKRILEVDPDRVATLVQITRNLLARGSGALAEPFAKRTLELGTDEPDHYEMVADVYRSQGKDDEMAEVYRRLADLYRQRGDEDRARDIQQRFVPATEFSAGDSDSLGGEVLGDDEFLASADLGGGDLLESDELGDDELLLDKELLAGDDSMLEGDEQPELELDEVAEADPIGMPDRTTVETLVDSVDESVSAASAGGSAVEPPPADADPDQLLAEASVYLRYGKRDKAIAHLDHILDQDPDHRLALEKLGEAYADGGDEEKAVELFMRAVKRAREENDEPAVSVLQGRIATLDPTAAASLDLQAAPVEPDLEPERDEADPSTDLPDVGPVEPEDSLDIESDAEVEESIDSDEIEIEIDIDVDSDSDEPADIPETGLSDDDLASLETDDDEFEAEPESELPMSEGVSVAKAAELSIGATSLSTAGAQQILEDLEEADFYMQQNLFDEAEQIYQRVLAVAPNHPRALVRLGEVAAARGQDPEAMGAVAEEQSTEVARSPQNLADETTPEVDEGISIEESPPAIVDAPDELSDLDVDDDDEIDEAPDSDDDTEVGSAEPQEAPVPAVETQPMAAAGDGFDLAAALSDALGDDSDGASFTSGSSDDGFNAVFDAFKKGVNEALSEGDHDAHYDLGIAYKEMGLIDDAIQEFKIAMGAPGRRGECLHLIGVCALEANQPQVAVEHLSMHLEAPDLGESQQLAGRLELGRAHQMLGDFAQARSAYEAVAAVDASFCGISELLAKLESATPPEGVPVADEDEYEGFDDLIAEGADEEDVAEDPISDPGENFDDLVSEANADDDDALLAAASFGDERGVASARDTEEVEAEAVDLIEEAVEASPEPVPAPKKSAAKKPAGKKKKKKKISFV